MNELKHTINDGELTVFLSGRIDSTNAADWEKEIVGLCEKISPEAVVLDCGALDYISSAGLRTVLRLKKTYSKTSVTNVSSEVYEILDVTGFTEMMEVKKAYRTISVEGCEAIGRGANGKVYRTDSDTVVKVYENPDALPEIHRERELARTAFVLGIPTAISYDVVRIEGGGYGSVFELLNATSFANLLIRGEMTVDQIAERSIDLLRLIHSTEVKPDSMPSMKAVALNWVNTTEGYLPDDVQGKLRSLIEAVPDDCHMLHGDYHVKNVMLQNGESILIDMDTLCHGHPVFELAQMFNAYRGFSLVDHDTVLQFLGITWETAGELWRKMLSLYFGTTDEEVISSAERKAMTVGYTRLLRRSIRRKKEGKDEDKQLEAYTRRLCELVPSVDTLLF